MILRVWRAPVEAPDVEPFAAFMRENLYPALEAEAACVGMTTAVDRETDPPRVVAVSVWTSMEGLEAFTGPDPEGVIFEEAETYLADEPSVDHHEVLDHVGW